MTPDRTRRLFELFDAIADLPPAERAARLRELCPDDDDAVASVERWLADEGTIGPLFDVVAMAGEAASAIDDDVPERIGRYRILSRLGAGAMGVVYRAEQPDTGQIVALKVLRRLFLLPAARARFAQEARIMARLRHPGIARILHAGIHRVDGERVPYFAMEFVPGARPVTDALRGRPLREGFALMATVCDAVQHGHAAGIFHRDLKPSNILVDGEGRARVIDFGIARSTDADVARSTIATSSGELLGSLGYMSPEQLAADRDGVTARSDVYSLGMVLYEVACGRRAHDDGGERLTSILARLREHDPPRPRSVRPDLPADAEAVILRAIERDPERRYPSAAALGSDLAAFIERRPVAARPPSPLYDARMFARRHRLGVSIAIGGGTLAIAAFIAMALLATWAVRSRDRSRGEAYYAAIRSAESSWKDGEYAATRRMLAACEPSRRGWEWHHLSALLDESSARIAELPRSITDIAITRDSGLLLAGLNGGEVRLLRLADSAELASVRADAHGVHSLALTPDDRRVITGGADGTVRILEVPSLREEALLHRSPRPIHRVALHPSGRFCAIAGEDTTCPILDLDGRVTHRLEAGPAWDARWSPSGDSLAIAGRGGGILAWRELDQPPLALRIDGRELRSIAFSPAGDRIAAGDASGGIHVWDRDGRPIASATRLTGWVRRIAFTADGSRLICGGEDRTLRWLDATSLAELDAKSGHEYDVMDIEPIPGTGGILTSGAEGWVLRWPGSPEPWSDPQRTIARGIRLLDVVPATGAIIAVGEQGSIRTLDGLGRALRDEFRAPWAEIAAVAARPDGGRLAVADTSANALILDARDGSPVVELPVGSSVPSAMRFSGDGRRLFIGRVDGSIDEYDAETGVPLGRSSTLANTVAAIDLARDGRSILAVGLTGNVIEVGPVGAAKPRRLSLPHADLRWAALSPDGRSIVAVATAERVTIVDVRSGEVASLIREHEGLVEHVEFSPDGRRFVTSSADGTARIWDAATRRALIALRIGTHVRQARWLPDGSTLITLDASGDVAAWDSVPARLRN